MRNQRGGFGLAEVSVATFIVAIMVAAILECGIHVVDLDHKDYVMTTTHALCQQAMENAVYQAQSVNTFDVLAASSPQYQYVGNYQGNTQYWIYEQDVATPLDGLKRVTVTLYMADPKVTSPTPTGSPVEMVTTVVNRP